MRCNYVNQNFVGEAGVEYYGEEYACYGDAEYKCDPRRYYLEGVVRKHRPGKKRADVRLVVFKHDHMMDYVPEGLGFFFPNTEVFSCGGCHMHYIEKSDLKQFPQLKILNLYENRLKYLPGNLFENTPHLEYFSVSSNPIRSIGKGFFNHTPKLKQFGFFTDCYSWERETDVETKKRSVIKGCEKSRSRPPIVRKAESYSVTANPIIDCEKDFVMREEIVGNS